MIGDADDTIDVGLDNAVDTGFTAGVDYDVVTIQDSALWTASSRLPGDVVEKAVKLIYQSEGLDHLVNVKSTAKAMSIDSGLTGIVTPVHKGAQNFWKSKGKTLTEVQIR